MPPNILVILTDQQRKDSLGCYGHPVTQTPNLDRLAGEGVRFERAYVANPICMPNRLSLFTGQYPRNHGMWTNGLLLDERPTLPGVLAAQGWQTASFGKIHFTPHGGTAGNRESQQYWAGQGDDWAWNGPYWGFQHAELTIGHTNALAHYGRWFRARGGSDAMRVPNPDETRPIPAALHDSTFVGERMVDFLTHQRQKDRPFFAVASFPDPHHPFDPPVEVARKYLPTGIPLPTGGPEDLKSRPAHYRRHFRGGWNRWGDTEEKHPHGITEDETRTRIANTCAMVDLIDQNVGVILDALELEGLRDDTLVLFTSDHGELLGDHGLWLKGPFFYEGLVNVPCLMRGPGVAQGAVTESLISTVDLLPTLFDCAGVEVPAWCDGLSQRTVLAAPSTQVRDACLVEYRNGYGAYDVASHTLVTEAWKYTRYQTGEEELTDLANDLQEHCNIAADPAYRASLDAMRCQLLDTLLATQARYPEQITHA